MVQPTGDLLDFAAFRDRDPERLKQFAPSTVDRD